MTYTEKKKSSTNFIFHTPLEIHLTVYNNLPIWYQVLAEFFVQEGSVVIIPDEATHTEVRSYD